MSAIAALALIAFVISVYLTWNTWQSDTILGCTGDSTIDCDAVLGSHWSEWLGLPVSLFGMLTYGAILAVAWPAAKQPFGLAGTCLLALTLTAAGAAVWFIAVQAVFVKSFCPYCMGVHMCGLVVVVLTLFLIRNTSEGVDYEQMGALLGVRKSESKPTQANNATAWSGFHPLIASGVACVGLVVLMGGQLWFAPQTLLVESLDDHESTFLEEEEPEEFSFASGEDDSQDREETGNEESPVAEPSDQPSVSASSRFVKVKGLRNAIDITKYPIIGNPDAPLVFVEMLDYTCKHCRHLHSYIQATLDRYGDQVVFAFYHVPLSKRCNPFIVKDQPGKGNACDYAQLAIGVSVLAPDKFPEFHDWLMESERPPSPGKARRRAMELAGEGVLLDLEIRAETSKKILEQCDTFKATNSGLPILLTEKGIIRGMPENERQWFEILEKQFDIKPLD